MDESDNTGRADHFGPCKVCGFEYEAQTAAEAADRHDDDQGHVFEPADGRDAL